MSGDYETIEYRVKDRIARITLDRPEKRNALSRELRDDIVAALHRAERDDDVTVILIDANGPVFCSGYDLTRRAAPDATTSPSQPR